MYFKDLTGVLPIEIVKEICDYDDRYKLMMKNVIKQIEKINKELEEYWHIDECLYYMTEEEESYRLKRGLRVSPLIWPLPKKRCFRYWNNLGIPTLAEVTPPRDHYMFYELKYNP
tara:strand:- start:195 stop:539 length:345 start_codon:yes stop_codon:yes gene_type:complete